VGRISYAPSALFDVTARARLDQGNLNVHYAEAVGSFGPQWLRLSGGWVYSINTPYFLDQQPPQGNVDEPRDEAQVSAATHYGNWRLSGYARRDLKHSEMIDTGADGAFENECFIFDMKFYRRYTSINNDHGDSTLLFEITLKTVGAFGFHAE
jgi:LPS-assembly protein